MGQRHDVDLGQQRGAQCLQNAGRRSGHAALRMAVIDQAGLVGLHARTASTQELAEGRS
jgi:hypothetical protein